MERNKEHSGLPLFFGIILVGCVIQTASAFKGNPLVFPDLREILRSFVGLIRQPKTWHLIGTTSVHLIMSLLLSSVIGVSLGLLQGLSSFARNLLRPMMMLFRSFPMIVLVIILMVLTDYKNVPVMATALILIPVLGEATAEGVRRLDRELIDAYRLDSKMTPYVIKRVHLPLLGGYLTQAYINAVGMGIKVVVTTEYLVQTKNSLGKAIFTSNYMNEYQEIYAYALMMILMVLLLGELPKFVRRIWKYNKE